jgi:O-antigen ligase
MSLTMPARLTGLRSQLQILALAFAVALFFFVPISKAATNLLTVVVWSLFLVAFDWRLAWQRIRSNPLAGPLLLLIGILILGYSYSPASLAAMGGHAQDYSRLLMPLVLMAMLSDAKWRRRCWWALIAACTITVISSYLSVFMQLPWGRSTGRGIGASHSIFANYLWQNILLSFFASICFFEAKRQSLLKLRAFWILMALLTLGSIFYLSSGRTGQVTALAVVLLVLPMFIAMRWRLPTFALILAALVLIANTSTVLQQRMKLAWQEGSVYSEGKGHGSSSVGLRLFNWQVNAKLVAQKPLQGHGSGSYAKVAEPAFNDAIACREAVCLHPHNQFLYFWVENGLFAVFAYVWLLWRCARAGWQGERNKPRFLLLPLAVILFLNSLVDSPLVVLMDRAFYTAILGLLAAELAATLDKHKFEG